MIGTHKKLESVLVSEGDQDTEVLVVQSNISNNKIRFMTGYGPQENSDRDKISQFYARLDEEADKAEKEEAGLIIELDCNAKIGPEYLKGAKHNTSDNGQLLIDLIERRNLTIVNTLEVCHGVTTRVRKVENNIEESTLDYFIVNERSLPFVTSMTVDENKTHVLTKYASKKGKKVLVESDHQALILETAIPWKRQNSSKERKEVFNLKNHENQKIFFNLTQNTTVLTDCFKDNSVGVEKQAKKLKHKIDSAIQQSFRKIRVTGKNRKAEENVLIEQQFDLKKQLKNLKGKNKIEAESKLTEIENRISELVSEKNAKKVINQFKGMSNIDGNFSNMKMWNVRKNICSKVPEPASAKQDKDGNLVTTKSALKKLYSENYTDRLSHKPIKKQYKELKQWKEMLCQERILLAKRNVSRDWDLDDIMKATKKLKNNKTRDPAGYINELFKPGIAGKDLTNALLKLANRMKSESVAPGVFTLADITSIYKNKGEKTKLENDRGIFRVMSIRQIIDNLIYEDEYPVIDKSMSYSNVGARKDMNIRNHLFIVYGVLNYAKHHKINLDIGIYDLRKCFDELWLDDCINDFYDAGFQNDKLSLLYEMNRKSSISIKTPMGMTGRKSMEKIVMQGSKFGSLLCSNSTDKIGKESLKDEENVFKYKECLPIPILEMVDDLLTISECGSKSVIMNSKVNTHIEMKKLTFSETKCHHIHVGRASNCCPNLKVHGVKMSEVDYDDYLGDVITNDFKMTRNITKRNSKSVGKSSQIINMLEELSLGFFYFKIAMILRNALFVSSCLVNVEVWYPLKEREICELEKTDRILLKRILGAPCSTNSELLFLDLGVIPLGHLIIARRIMFLHYILTRETDHLLSKFFKTQCREPLPGDWCEQVKKDLATFKIKDTFEQISKQSKDQFRRKIKSACEKTALKDLLESQTKHSKGSNLKYDKLEMQGYLKNEHINPELAKFLFKIRSRGLSVKNNRKSQYLKQSNDEKQLYCPLGCLELDDQKHLLTCVSLQNQSIDFKYEDLFHPTDTVDQATKMKTILTKMMNLWKEREQKLEQSEDDNE